MRATRASTVRLPLDLARMLRPAQASTPTGAPIPPPLPPGRAIALPGRGETFVRVDGELGAESPLVLLHGWGASADLTFFRLYDQLRATGATIVAPDLRGHGRGLRSEEPVTLEAMADDTASLIEVLGLDAPIVVGYSMGGTVALLLAHQHRDLVGALVLCATAPSWDISVAATRAHWMGGVGESLRWRSPARPRRAHGSVASLMAADTTIGPFAAWLAAEELRGYAPDLAELGRVLDEHDTTAILGQLEIPAASVVTLHDEIAPPARQRLIASRLNGKVFEVDGAHDAPLTQPPAYAEVLIAAIGAVTPTRRR
jgi:pimeloyl-ACP methyl ester carboxylesterase